MLSEVDAGLGGVGVHVRSLHDPAKEYLVGMTYMGMRRAHYESKTLNTSA
ncbi:hypothetical protein Rumeso_04903 [Rubellimicrobium mesophilum DSM 19309]|uniref:Uncharacterized protein n=1 Tax=Rubellimicrobium mesophilum DSM 19309 TaxID=442562 RepID=A0A017HAJ4_9RHOB|nr:hypothetical protein Rumeso_04903 [Rubellimicrobium mesophilum DSM 19309]